MADTVIQKFCALSAEERLDLLQRLPRHLSSKECDFLVASISQKCDPFRILPTELILQIFDHLPIFDTWALRSVCKGWQEKLSSEHFVRAAVARWQTHEPHDSAHDGGEDSLESQIQHLRAMKTGRPISVRVINDTASRMQTGSAGPHFRLAWRRMAMKGTRVAYVSSRHEQGDSVTVLDLITGEKNIYRSEAREKILLVILTMRVVAFVGYDAELYVQRFSEPFELLRQARLPSLNIRVAGGDGFTIALVADDFEQDGLPVSSVILFDAETGHLRNLAPTPESRLSIQTEHGYDERRIWSSGILVNAPNEWVDVFTLWHCQRFAGQQTWNWTTLQILHVRLSFAGEILASSTQDSWMDIHSQVSSLPLTMADPHPTGYSDEYRITSCELGSSNSLPLRVKSTAIFDSKRASFQPQASNVSSGQKQVMDTLWKGRHYRPAISNDCWEYVSYLNDSFLVSLEVNRRDTTQSRIRIECFDPRVRMAESEDVVAD